MSLSGALAALKTKDYLKARQIMAAIAVTDYDLTHFLVKGLSELSLEAWQDAASTFTAASSRYPENALIWLNKGIAEENLGWLDAALESQHRSLGVNPAQAEAYGNLSNLYRKKNLFLEAEKMARRALDMGANKGEALNGLGLALARQGRFKEAESTFDAAHESDPANPAIALNRANLALDNLRFSDAWALFASARLLRDDALFRHDEALGRLLAGEFEKGWELLESRLELPRALRLTPSCPRWLGESLSRKRLLIVAEQGFGDTIQFSHFAKYIVEGELVWAVPATLKRLLGETVRGQVFDETEILMECDYFIPLMSLPLMTRHFLPEECRANIEKKTSPVLPAGEHHLKIGLVWTGSPTHGRNYERAIGLPLLQPLFDAIDADFYAPFVGSGLDQIGEMPVQRLDHLIGDFADTAALLQQLDFLVTVDTAVAHLAGVCGIKTFLLLPSHADWRWGPSGERTPWYPSVTLMRQPVHGDWQSVIAALGERLCRKG